MTLALRTRLSLGFRMFVSLIALSIVSIAATATAVLLAGLLAWIAVLGVTFVLGVLYQPVFSHSGVLFKLAVRNHVIIGSLGGLLLLPSLYFRPVREEIEAFQAELGTTGTSASERHPEIATVAGRLAQQAGIAAPDVYIVNRSRPESYAIGGQSDGSILLTRGLIRALSDEELDAVIAHEISHLANGDSRVMRIALVPLLVAEHLAPREPSKYVEASDDADLRDKAIILATISTYYIPTAILWAVLWVSSSLLRLCSQVGLAVLSRGREFAADRSAAELTGSPGALASALQELDDERGRPAQDGRTWKRSASALDILPQEESRWSWGPFRTHPSTETRIRRLEALARRTADSESG